MSNMKLIFVDVETTGVRPDLHAIWQLAARVVIDDEVKEVFKRNMKPFPGQLVAPDALAVGGITMEQLRTFEEPAAVYTDFIAMLGRYVKRFDKRDKFFMVAYNAPFDSEFIRKWFDANGADKYCYGSHFWTPSLCVMQMAGYALAPVRHTLPNFKLATVLDHIGIPLENAHDAAADIAATHRLFDHFVANGLKMRAPVVQ